MIIIYQMLYIFDDSYKLGAIFQKPKYADKLYH